MKQCVLPSCNSEYVSFQESIPLMKNNGRSKLLSYYIELINSFDPFVNRIICYYIRLLSLFADGYHEESVNVADNVVDVIVQSIKQHKRLPTKERNDMLGIVAKEIDLSPETIEQLKNLYQLRCIFSAHPAPSKWWDFSEIYEGKIELMINAIKTLIIKYLLYERDNRNIEKNPPCWSDWFLVNCDMLFDSVWFYKLPVFNTSNFISGHSSTYA